MERSTSGSAGMARGSLREFSHQELRAATKKFAEDGKLGEGGFGCVYKGRITLGGTQTDVAVKMLNQGGQQGEREWMVSDDHESAGTEMGFALTPERGGLSH